jgi:hypothetical protein
MSYFILRRTELVVEGEFKLAYDSGARRRRRLVRCLRRCSRSGDTVVLTSVVVVPDFL